MDKDEFIKEVEKLGINLTEKQICQLNQYYELLVEWNQKINLTRIIEEKDVYLKHFYDSITLFKAYNLRQNVSLCDIGTGAGFPGIVLKIVFPTLSVTLVDALLKRVNFLNIVIERLQLKNIETVHARVEDYAKNNYEKFDIVTCRAVANLTTLLNYSIPLVKVNGYFLPMKANCEEELMDAKRVFKKYHLEFERIIEFELPKENSHRTILVIKKVSSNKERSIKKIKNR